jgi:predicted restriction endonuclease
LSREFKDVAIKSYKDVLFTLISLNEEHSFLNNPTISLLLHLIASDESRYTPVFLEWFEKQFVNQKDKYREAFGNKYLPEYRHYKKNVKANIYCNEVVKEQPNLDIATKQEPTTKAEVKIIDDVTQEIIETVDMVLTHKRKIGAPIQITAIYSKTSDIDYSLEAAVEKDDADNTTHYTLSFYGSTFVKVKEKQVVEIHEHGKKPVLETLNYAKEKLVKELLLTAIIAVDYTNDIYVIKTEDWTEDSAYNITDKKGSTVVVDSLIYEDFYDGFKIFTHQDVFGDVIDLNKKAIYKNPTISLLLRFIEYGSSNYSPVFLKWYEEQFINPKNKYHAEFGSAFKLEYRQLKEKATTNTGIPFPIVVAREQPPLCVDAKQEPTTEPVVDEPKEVTEPVDTPLTYSYALSSHSVPDSDPSDLLFKELASEGFFDEALTNKDDIEYLELPEKHREAFVKTRIGQGYFRDALVDYWGECAITKCKEISLLKASHIKPWSKCDPKEAVDPFNGFLLSPTLDAAFDKGFITFDDTGKVLISVYLKESDAEILGIFSSLCLSRIEQRHQHYLNYHREHIFRKS